MKFFTPRALIAALFVSAVAVIPFLPAAKDHPELFGVEARLTSSVTGAVQLYFDRGTGFTEADSSRVGVVAGTAQTCFLSVPPGEIRALRFDPLDRAGTVALESLTIVNRGRRTLQTIPLSALRPVAQIAELRTAGGRSEIVIPPGASDPQLLITFDPPLRITAGFYLLVGFWPRLFGLFGALALLLFALDRRPALCARASARVREFAGRPGRALATIAALAVAASSYPVIFLGKSLVSPNLGTVLLYETFPTLPGYDSSDTVDVKLADIGAVMWSHVPLSVIQHRALTQGEAPLWNRYNAAGSPLLGQGQSMFGDPLHLGVIAAGGAAWAWDLKYLVAKWLFAAGLGLLVHAFTRHFAAAAIVAAATPFIGFFLYRINHPAFFSLCYAPWPLYCLVRVAQADTRCRTALWLAGLVVANAALMNSGTVKEAYMLLLCMNFSGACILLASEAPWRERLAKLAALAWAGVLFVLLTAPVWATFLHTLGHAYTAYNAVSAYQIQPSLLLGAFDEIFYRPLMGQDRVFSPSLNFLLLLGVLYFLATLRTHFASRAVLALAASSLVPLALAFGLVPPHWIVQLPFFGNIAHLDNTFSCALIVLWSVLAGIGFATAARRLASPEGRADLIVAGLLLAALVFGWIAFRQVAHRPIAGPTFTVNQPGQVLPVSPFIWGYLASLLLGAGALALAMRGALVRGALSPARGLVVALAATLLLWRHGLHARAMGFETFAARPTVRVDLQAPSAAVDFVRAAVAREPGRAFGLGSSFFPGWSGVYDLESVHSPDALVNPFLRGLVDVSGVERIWDWRLLVDSGGVANARPFFDALNVRFYLDGSRARETLRRTLQPALAADLDVYESPTAWPRAFFSDRLFVYEQAAEFGRAIRAGDGRPFAAAQQRDLASRPELAALPRDLATRAVAAATDYRLTANTTSFKVRAAAAGVVVLTEVFWPGDFRAEVDGRKVPVLRLNHAFKGVTVGAGDHTVTIRYVPRNFPVLLALGGAGLALAAGSLFVACRRARPA